ncbi:MAG: glycosyltransferase family 2 protein [Flavobacteriaceae bacterium]|nr:glycosyltransferase family 2 protein [Flavobacteriaceae bacterium]
MQERKNVKITALLIVYNEVSHIREVLENVSFADEIIVVDSFSTDGTVDIIRDFPKVNLFQNPFENFTDQRNFAISKASNNWILFIDADERLPQKTIDEIKTEVCKPDAHAAYFIRRQIYFQKKRLRFGGRNKDKIERLFQKDKALYKKGRLVHEKLDVQGTVGILKNEMLHYPYKNFSHIEQKRKHYAQLKAQEIYQSGETTYAVWFALKGVYKFVRQYVLRLGFLDGVCGLVLAILNAKYVYMRHVYVVRIKTNL